MSSSTARLGLKRPDGSDPFLRSDFVDNYNKLDAAPGYVPCLSTSRPAWGAAQAGMLISETDTGRILRWTGSAWAPPTNMGQAWSIGTNPGLIMANNTSSTITVAASIPVPRTCKMLVMLTIRLALGALHEQAGSLDVWIDSTTAGVGGPVNWVLPSTGDSSNSIATHPMVIGERSVAAGNHSVALRIVNGNMGFDLGATHARGLVILSE